jgi:hypothetical protein
MTLIDLTLLMLGLNHLVDYNFHKDVSIEEAESHIESGDLFEWLDEKFSGHIDLSLHRGRPAAQEITKGLQDLLGGYKGSERRKWGVAHNGICLLIAWVNELIQQRAWTDDERPATFQGALRH